MLINGTDQAETMQALWSGNNHGNPILMLLFACTKIECIQFIVYYIYLLKKIKCINKVQELDNLLLNAHSFFALYMVGSDIIYLQ